MVFIEFAILLVALFLLVEGSDFFVEMVARLAKLFHISDFAIGLTVVALGTSLPELGVSIAAALKNESSLIIGNIVGSNIANIALILGLGALITSLHVKRVVFDREGTLLLLTTVIFTVLVLDRTFSWTEGIAFIVIFAAYFVYLFEYPNITRLKGKGILFRYFYFGKLVTEHTLNNIQKSMDYRTYQQLLNQRNGKKLRNYFKTGGLALVGLAVVVIASRVIVAQVGVLAEQLNITTGFIAVTIVAVGTSLPELAVTIAAAKKKKGDLILGTLLGSNIYNLLMILGVSALITPLAIGDVAMYYTIPTMLLVTVLLLWFIRRDWTLQKSEGITFLLLYVLFLMGLTFWLR